MQRRKLFPASSPPLSPRFSCGFLLRGPIVTAHAEPTLSGQRTWSRAARANCLIFALHDNASPRAFDAAVLSHDGCPFTYVVYTRITGNTRGESLMSSWMEIIRSNEGGWNNCSQLSFFRIFVLVVLALLSDWRSFVSLSSVSEDSFIIDDDDW